MFPNPKNEEILLVFAQCFHLELLKPVDSEEFENNVLNLESQISERMNDSGIGCGLCLATGFLKDDLSKPRILLTKFLVLLASNREPLLKLVGVL